MTKQNFLTVQPAGLALSITVGVAYALCAIAVAIWPASFVRFFGSWFHGVDLSKIAATTPITFSGFLIGLVSIMLAAYLAGIFYAWVYIKCQNHCQEKWWITKKK